MRFYYGAAHYLWEKATGTDEARDAVDAVNAANARREVDAAAGRSAISRLGPLAADIKAVASDVRALAGLDPAMPPPYAYPSARLSAVAKALTAHQSDLDDLGTEMRRTVARWEAVFNDSEPMEGPAGFWRSMWDAKAEIGGEMVDVGQAVVSPVTSTVEFIRHPIQTTKDTLTGIVFVASHPVDSAKALWTYSKDPLHWPEMMAGAASTIAARNPSAGAKKATKAASKARKAKDALADLRAKQARARARGEKPHKLNQREKAIAAKAREAERLAKKAGPMGWAYAGKVWKDFVSDLRARLALLRGPRRGEGSVPLPVGTDAQLKRLKKELAGMTPYKNVEKVRQTVENLSTRSIRHQELMLRHVVEHLAHGLASSLKLKPSVNGWGQFGHGVQEDQEAGAGPRRPR